MKKWLLSVTLIVVFLFYSWYDKRDTTDMTIAIPTQPLQSDNTLTITPTQSVSLTRYKDGIYTGDVEDAFYGNMQVQAIIAGGRIADVKFLQYPNDRTTSIQINTLAMPVLKQEAIQAQSAQVDVVSSASASSQAFVLSLKTALDKARK